MREGYKMGYKMGSEVIATLDSLESDINRAYDLGWMANQLIRDELINAVNQARYWYNQYEVIKDSNPWLANYVKNRLISKLDALKTKLDFYRSRGYITTECSDLLYNQIEYIIIHL